MSASSSSSAANFWRKESSNNHGYLPFASRSSSSGSLSTMTEKTYSDFTNEAPSYYSNYRIAAVLAPTNWTATWRRRLLVLLHLTSLAFGIFGLYEMAAFSRGKLMYTPVYSKYDIAQAGYNRNLVMTPPTSILTTANSGTLSTDGISEGKVEEDRISKEASTVQTQGTLLDTWTFPSSSSLSSTSAAALSVEPKSSEQHLLILSPIRNAKNLLPNYFRNLESLEHPKSNTSIGFLLSDEEDETGILIQHWVNEQISKGEYRHITLLRKDFNLLTPQGDARHRDWVQSQRRALMAKARTLLLMSTLNPTIDWVFWLDVDVQEMPSTIIQDLMHYGHVKVENEASSKVAQGSSTVLADIITPNIMYRHKGRLRGYDLNNWAETPESRRMKESLDPDVILHEGDPELPTHRLHLARQWVAPNVTLDPFQPSISGNNDLSSTQVPSNLYDPSSEAYIGNQIPLDAVGGVATLVRASVHFFGGVFPSWNVDHSVETEGFGVLAKLVGARVVGLPNYLVVHR